MLGIDSDRGVIAEDAGDAGSEAGPRRYCGELSPPAQQCSDFDGEPRLGGWDNDGKTPNPGEQGGGRMVASTEQYTSSPSSLAMDTPALLDGTATARAVLLKTLDANPPRLSLKLALRIDREEYPSAPGGFVTLVGLAFGQVGAVIVFRTAAGTTLQVVPQGQSARLVPGLPVGTFREVTLVLRNAPTDGGPDGLAYALVDRQIAATVPLPTEFQQPSNVPRVLVGPQAKGPLGAIRVQIDDVVLYHGAL